MDLLKSSAEAARKPAAGSGFFETMVPACDCGPVRGKKSCLELYDFVAGSKRPMVERSSVFRDGVIVDGAHACVGMSDRCGEEAQRVKDFLAGTVGGALFI